MARHPRLTRLQRDFAHAFVAHENPHVRLNATASYLAVNPHCTRPAVAKAAASRLLTKPHVRAAIQTLQVQADAETLCRLRDWKTEAIQVQPLLLELCRGRLDGRPLATPLDIARAHVMLDAIKEVMDRGFPKQIYARLSVQFHAREALAKLLGVDQSQFPEHWDEEGC